MIPRIVVAVLLLAALPVSGGELEVSPVFISLGNAEKSTVVRLRNRSADPARYQISIFAWDQSPDGEMKLSSTEDVLAFPHVLSIAAGEEKIVRVGTAKPSGDVERPYRLFIEEMPPPARPDEPSRVQVLSRIGIPVFVAPNQAISRATVGAVRVQRGKVEFTVQNSGNVHVRPSAVRVVLEGDGGKVLEERALGTWYVLASGRRDYAVDVGERCAEVRGVAVEIVLPRDTLRGRADVAPGACGS